MRLDRCAEVPVGIVDGRAVTLIGKLDDQSNRWEGEYPTQALGS